jgi:hypothetical protein
VTRDYGARSSLANLSQWRVHFRNDDRGRTDLSTDAVTLVSGDSATNRPYLTVTYEVP